MFTKVLRKVRSSPNKLALGFLGGEKNEVEFFGTKQHSHGHCSCFQVVCFVVLN